MKLSQETRDYHALMSRGRWVNTWNTPKDQQDAGLIVGISLATVVFIVTICLVAGCMNKSLGLGLM